MKRHLTALLLLSCFAGCDRSAPPPGVVVQDSAGVVIVENQEPAWGDNARWHVPPSPSRSIGRRDGLPAQQFFRVATTLFLPGNRIAVIDGGSLELRLFDDDGLHLQTTGGEGDGPGEFRGRLSAIVVGDSIGVFDPGSNRLSFFTHDLAFVGAESVESAVELEVPLSHYGLIGRIPERGYVLQKQSSRGNTGLAERTVWWDAGANLIVNFDGMVEGTIGESSGMEMWAEPGRSGVVRWGRFTRASVHEGRLHIGHGRSYEVKVYGPRGGLRRVVRKRQQGTTGEAADAAFLEQVQRLAEEQNAPPSALEELYADLERQPRADTLPAYSNLIVDAEGYLWVERYRPSRGGRVWSDQPPEWDIFDGDGRWLGSVHLAEGFEPHGIGEDYLIGVWTDEFDVEHVHTYALNRNPTG